MNDDAGIPQIWCSPKHDEFRFQIKCYFWLGARCLPSFDTSVCFSFDFPCVSACPYHRKKITFFFSKWVQHFEIALFEGDVREKNRRWWMSSKLLTFVDISIIIINSLLFDRRCFLFSIVFCSLSFIVISTCTNWQWCRRFAVTHVSAAIARMVQTQNNPLSTASSAYHQRMRIIWLYLRRIYTCNGFLLT